MSFLKKLFGKTSQTQIKNANTETVFYLYKDKIYPWVKVIFTGDDDPRNTPTQIELSGSDLPIIKSWMGDLSIFYVADTGDNFRVLLQRDLPNDITHEKLHELSVNNLSNNIEFKLHETNFGGYGLIAGGDHEAGAICLPDLWDWLIKHFNDNLIVAVPSKDLVVMVPESNIDKIVNLKIFVHEIFKGGERLLTRNIFRVDRETKEWTIVDSVN